MDVGDQAGTEEDGGIGELQSANKDVATTNNDNVSANDKREKESTGTIIDVLRDTNLEDAKDNWDKCSNELRLKLGSIMSSECEGMTGKDLIYAICEAIRSKFTHPEQMNAEKDMKLISIRSDFNSLCETISRGILEEKVLVANGEKAKQFLKSNITEALIKEIWNNEAPSLNQIPQGGDDDNSDANFDGNEDGGEQATNGEVSERE